MKTIKRLFSRIRSLSAPYDVPADHAFSRQSVKAQRAVHVEARGDHPALEKTILEAAAFMLVQRCKKSGFVLDISLKSTQPPRMGQYEHQISLRAVREPS